MKQWFTLALLEKCLIFVCHLLLVLSDSDILCVAGESTGVGLPTSGISCGHSYPIYPGAEKALSS